jgi:nucleotide-binding universal stress UspA family protein
MKVICVPVVDRPECAVALSTAFAIGNQLGSTVMGYHLRSHGSSEVTLPDEVAALVNGEEDDSENSDPNQQSARALFQTIAEQQGYTFKKKAAVAPIALWQAKAGSPNKLFSIVGPVTDMIVVSRPASKSSNKAQKFMLAALLNSSKPVLVLPQQATEQVGKKVCIAWNQSPESARAVSAALPILHQAEEVNIITNGPQNRVGPKARHLQQYLTMHGINSEHIQCNESNDVKALFSAYRQSQSDLMIMGAYSRSRLRQVIFGGVTEHMLYKADIPVLMLHS